MKRFLLAALLAVVTSVHAQWPGYTQQPSGGASGITIGTTAITGGATTQVLYNLAGVVSSSANLTYSDTLLNSGPGLKVGTGTTTSVGLTLGYISSGNAGIWRTAAAANAAANAMLYNATASTVLNADTGGDVYIQTQGNTKAQFSSTAGAGPTITAGTATTDVAALSVTRTNNNAAVATGVKFTFTDTTSAAGFKPLEILCGASGTTICFDVSKAGNLSATGDLTLASGSQIAFGGASTILRAPSGNGTLRLSNAAANDFSLLQFGGTTSSFPALKRSTTELQARLADDSAYANVDAAGLKNAGVLTITSTDPTIASGGCTSPTVTNANGTAYFTIDVGTSCSGSQPVVFTLPAATTGWNCYARNITNGATSAPAQTGAVSTTSVTITNFARTTGVAAAWTDGDDVVVSCLGG